MILYTLLFAVMGNILLQSINIPNGEGMNWYNGIVNTLTVGIIIRQITLQQKTLASEKQNELKFQQQVAINADLLARLIKLEDRSFTKEESKVYRELMEERMKNMNEKLINLSKN